MGLPEAPMVFLLVVEVLGINIRNNHKIEGIDIDANTVVKSDITINDLPIRNIAAIRVGFTELREMLNDVCEFLSCEEVRVVSQNTVSFLQYGAILKSITPEWRIELRSANVVNEEKPDIVFQIIETPRVAKFANNKMNRDDNLLYNLTELWNTTTWMNLLWNDTLIISLRHSVNGDFCGHSRFVLWHENLTTFVS